MSVVDMRSRSPIELGHRFSPIAETVTGPQALYPTQRIFKPSAASRDRETMMRGMQPQLMGVTFVDGRTHKVVEEEGRGNIVRQLAIIDGHPKLLAEFDATASKVDETVLLTPLMLSAVGGKVIPYSPWAEHGTPADMLISLDSSKPRFYDLEPHLFDETLNQRANTLQMLMDSGAGAVFTGRITSPRSLRDKNLQSVMYPHDQGHILPAEFARLGPASIREFRQQALWDKAFHGDEASASNMIAASAARVAEGLLRDYWSSGTVRQDQLGFTIELPDYTVNDFRGARRFLVPIFQQLDTSLDIAHSLVYASNPKYLDQFVLTQQNGNEFDVVGYERYLKETDRYPDTPLANTLHTLLHRGDLRDGFGHIFSAGFWKDEGAQFEFSIGVLKSASHLDGLGPNEVRGLRSQRLLNGAIVPRDTVLKNAEIIRSTI
ncbi:MAG TPA: hypothetical protein VLF93_02900 [Candidatus Saccharimonadales bacterium]|nr:hypothetical protein [Candidatus Saccharimonadales bacterium]